MQKIVYESENHLPIRNCVHIHLGNGIENMAEILKEIGWTNLLRASNISKIQIHDGPCSFKNKFLTGKKKRKRLYVTVCITDPDYKDEHIEHNLFKSFVCPWVSTGKHSTRLSTSPE